MSWLAGIDVDTRAIHCVFVDEDDIILPEYHCWPLTGHDAWERTRTVRQALPRHMFGDVRAVGLEDPAGKPGFGLSLPCVKVTGAVLACLPADVLVQPWRPSEWRKRCGMPGNCSKADVAAFLPSASWNRGWPQDAFDAYFVALATRNAITIEAAA